MLKTIAIVVVVLIVVVMGLAMTKPDSFRVERSMTIQAAPEKVFAQIDDFHNWAAWSPWEKLDPAMKKTFSGAPTGKGAAYAWEGNSKVGAGSMEILDAASPAKVVIKLDFLRPFEGHNTAEFSIAPAGVGASTVTWAMYGPSPFMTKVMMVFTSMDGLIGKDFENGLANLKSVSESKPGL